MIIQLRSDHPTFKTVELKDGFNAIIAKRTKESTEKDSRNGTGKSTFIEIIHFCLGSEPKQNKGLLVKELDNWTFTLDIEMKNKIYSISRNTTDYKSVEIEGYFEDWPIKPLYDRVKDKYYMKIDDWRLILGLFFFSLPLEFDKEKYTPTYRSLVPYFSRRGVGAFTNPFKTFTSQPPWNVQVNNTYLLKLNWNLAKKFQLLKDDNKALKDLKKALKNQNIFEEYVGTIGELKAEKVRIEEDIIKLERQFKDFKVHPQYLEFQKSADDLTKKIQELVKSNTIKKLTYEKYENSLFDDDIIPLNEVEKIYSEAGLLFSANLRKSLEDVVLFHDNILFNRKEFLHTEILSLKKETMENEKQISKLSDERSHFMQILETHGALEEYTKFQDQKSKHIQHVEHLKNRIESLEKLETGTSTLKIKTEELLQLARKDLEDRNYQVENALRIFNEYSQSLYSEPGILSIDTTKNGYEFNIDIKREMSQGVGYMKIFCYDLMLSNLNSKRHSSPLFLIHDSTIFDGVDERQIAKAIELAARESKEHGFQYICTLNSDCIPYNDFTDDFKSVFDSSVRKEFTDETHDGGLLGFRY